MELNEKQLGRRLQEARQAAGLTQQALCQKAGLSYSTLAKIERGAIKTPSIFTIQSIAAALGSSLDDLVGTPLTPRKARGRSRSGVRFVYFDLNNCLIHYFNRAFIQIADESGQPADIVETLFWRYNDQTCRGEMTLVAFNKVMAEHLHLPHFDWHNYYLVATEAMPHMASLVTWVHEHYGVGLLTNSMPGLVDQVRKKGLIPSIPYDAVIDSSEVHLLKPEREIYELAQAKAGCAPEEILFIDDTRSNLMAAQKLGWHVMWFDDSRPEESANRVRDTLQLA